MFDINHNAQRTIEVELQLLRSQGGIVFAHNAGCLKIQGNDSLDFLHRLTTNDLLSLTPGSVGETILTTEKGKIIDVVLLLVRPGDNLLLTSAGSTQRVKEWLNKFIVMDDVIVEDVSSEYAQLKIFGDVPGNVIRQELNLHYDGSLRKWHTHMLRDLDFIFASHQSVTAPGWLVIARTSEENQIAYALSEMMNTDLFIVSQDAFDLWRIENGYPRVGFELTEKVHPLESGAERAVSFTKGCYIGQEVIARLDTYQKVQRHLRGVIFEEDHVEEIPGGTSFTVGRDDAGFLTSFVYHPDMKKYIGLGLIRLTYEHPGERLEIELDGKKYHARVASLPFEI